MKARIASGPPFRHASPDGSLLDDQIAGYEHITGDRVRRSAKRNLIAACYRVHGDDFLPLVLRTFTRTGTVTNLLGKIRCLARSTSTEMPPPQAEPAEAAADNRPALLPGLIYGEADRPVFDPTSARRYDRRRSNPAAVGLFDDDELQAAPARSPTAEALGR